MMTSISNSKYVLLFAVVLTVGLFSCQQKDEALTGSGSGYHVNDRPERLNAQQEQQVHDLIQNVSDVKIWDENRNRMYNFDVLNRDFSFSDAGDGGWNFSDNDVVWDPAPEGGGTLFISSSALGGNTGGTVVAGSSALDITYTFCFSASEEALGMDLFDYGINMDGISMVIGIAGDFEALMNDEVDEGSEFTDYFQGFAVYFVYDDEASGNYDILDWFDSLEDDVLDLSDNGFAYLLDFVEMGLYFSSDGTLNVSGGQMQFDGEYFALTSFLTSTSDEDDDYSFAFVPGFGIMGCN